MNNVIERIAVIGGDEHAWSVAARLLVGLRGQGISIVVVDEEPEDPRGVIPMGLSAHSFHRKIGIDEPTVIRQMDGAYSYGVALKKENQDEDFFSFSPSGDLIDRVQFHHYVAKYRNGGGLVSLSDYNLAALATKENRFAHPKPNSPLEKLDYAFNVSRKKYIDLLRTAVLARDVSHVCSKVRSISRNDLSLVTALSLANNQSLEVDFVFDCTGLTGDTGWESWGDYYSYDRQLRWIEDVDGSAPDSRLSLEQLELASHNYCSSAKHVDHCVSFSSRSLTDAGASELAAKLSPNFDEQRVNFLDRPPRIRAEFWHGNVLNIGANAGYAGNQLFSDLYHTHSAIERWLELYPSKGENALLAKQYNTVCRQEYGHVRDAHAMVISASQHCSRAISLSKSLSHRLSLFEGIGSVAFYENDVLEPHQWVNLLCALGCLPKRSDALIDHLEQDDLHNLLVRVRTQLQAHVSELPDYDQLLNAIRQAS